MPIPQAPRCAPTYRDDETRRDLGTVLLGAAVFSWTVVPYAFVSGATAKWEGDGPSLEWWASTLAASLPTPTGVLWLLAAFVGPFLAARCLTARPPGP